MEEIEEFEINLDNVHISSLDKLSSSEKFIVYFQYDYIFKLRNLQVFLNSKFNEDNQNSELLDYIKSFVNIKELDYFYEFLKSLQVLNLKEFELFFETIKMNYDLMIRQRSSARTLNISVENFARVKGIYYPCYERMEVIFQEGNCFFEKTEKLTNLTKYIVKPFFN